MTRPPWTNRASRAGRAGLALILVMMLIPLAAGTGCAVVKSILVPAPPDATVSDFLQLLSNGYLREALNRMDASVRTKYTPDGLTAINLMMGNLRKIDQTKSTVSGSQGRVEINITFSNGYAEKWAFLLAKQSGEWVITEWQHPAWK